MKNFSNSAMDWQHTSNIFNFIQFTYLLTNKIFYFVEGLDTDWQLVEN